jgi:hypothetical protein
MYLSSAQQPSSAIVGQTSTGTSGAASHDEVKKPLGTGCSGHRPAARDTADAEHNGDMFSAMGAEPK